MGELDKQSAYETLRLRWDADICYIQLYRPEFDNTINATVIREMAATLDDCRSKTKIVVLEGLPEVFCFGADLQALQKSVARKSLETDMDPEPLYDLLLQLANGPYLTIAHVRGKANAGGVGLVAACDIVLCEAKAVFSLSELLFGLTPACVLPFLTRRVGYPKANYMTLLTQPVIAEKALAWGLVDAVEDNSANLLRKHLLRLRLLSEDSISRYKSYRNRLNQFLEDAKPEALRANSEAFSNPENLRNIERYLSSGKFPWEND